MSKGETSDTGTVSTGFVIICFQMQTLAHSDNLRQLSSQFSIGFPQKG